MALTSDKPEQIHGVLLRPEVELLLCCAQSPAGEVSADRVARIRQLLRAEIDWEYLLSIAHRHALSPLLHWQLNRSSGGLRADNIFAFRTDSNSAQYFHRNVRREISQIGCLTPYVEW